MVFANSNRGFIAKALLMMNKDHIAMTFRNCGENSPIITCAEVQTVSKEFKDETVLVNAKEDALQTCVGGFLGAAKIAAHHFNDLLNDLVVSLCKLHPSCFCYLVKNL
ncbi:hypothetical protein AgCh_023406 [Apium graveolens]